MKTVIWSTVFATSMALFVPAVSADHHMEGQHMMEGEHGEGHMMNGQHHQMMRQVEGVGEVNKVMGEHHMLNITHEPIGAMNWPKMRMNFKTDESVELGELKQGDRVRFTLEVDADDNYRIIDIEKE